MKTISILPDHLLPYWRIAVERLERFADFQAGIGKSLDPPPTAPEAAAMRRAWDRFAQRADTLRDCFGQLIASGIHLPKDLWIALRRAKQSLGGILLFLAQFHHTSLLGDYRCLRPVLSRLAAPANGVVTIPHNVKFRPPERRSKWVR